MVAASVGSPFVIYFHYRLWWPGNSKQPEGHYEEGKSVLDWGRSLGLVGPDVVLEGELFGLKEVRRVQLLPGGSGSRGPGLGGGRAEQRGLES